MYFRFYLTHKEYRACDDKTNNAKLLTSKEYNVSAREVTIYGVLPFSRYTIMVRAVPKRPDARLGFEAADSSEIKVITPQRRPTLRIKEMAVVEKESTKLSFTWADLPLDDPRILLKQNECEQFESLPGQLHYKIVEGSEGVIVREGNLSLTSTSLEVESLAADTEYSISIFVTDSEGRYDQAAGSTITATTAAAGHDVTIVVVGIIVGLIFIFLLVALYAFLRRRGLPQQRRKPLPRVETGVYSADRPILR